MLLGLRAGISLDAGLGRVQDRLAVAGAAAGLGRKMARAGGRTRIAGRTRGDGLRERAQTNAAMTQKLLNR